MLNRIPFQYNIFTIDIRALSLMRIGVGITLLVDTIIRIINVEAHYSDNGVLPLEGLFRFLWNQYTFSVYTLCNSWQLQSVVFLLNILCIVAFTIGYRTKLFTFICWVFLLSVHNRNPLIHQGGDDLLRLLLFWGMFFPWGYYYSVDSVQTNFSAKPKSTSYTSVAVLGYLLQVMWVYVFSGLLKNSPEWNGDFTALYYALSFDQIVLPFGKVIYAYPQLMKFTTAVVYYIELITPVFLLIPYDIPFFRMSFFIILILLHIGIAATLNVGLFPLIAIVAMIGLIPGNVIERLSQPDFIKKLKKDLTTFKIYRFRKLSFPKTNWLKESLALFLIFFMLFWNIKTTGKVPVISEFRELDWMAYIPRIDQHWGMFAPTVFKDDGWFIFEGKKSDGKTSDILNTGEDVSTKRPSHLPVIFRSDRWRKYSENFLLVVNAHLRPYFCFFIIHRWNRQHEKEKIYELKIHYVKEVSLADYKTMPLVKELLCTCSIPKNN